MNKIVLPLLGFLLVSFFTHAQSFVWAKQFGGASGTQNVDVYAMTTDPWGNIITVGDFSGTADFDAGTGIYNMTSAGTVDIFILKSDANGNFIWAKQIGATMHSYARSVATDAFGNIYFTGQIPNTVDVDPGTGIYLLGGSNSGYDILVEKLDLNGNFVWAGSMGGLYHCRGFSVALDNFGGVYFTGDFTDSIDCDFGTGTFWLVPYMGTIGAHDAFILKTDVNGNFIWAKNIGGYDHDYAYTIKTDALGNVIIGGMFRQTVDFNPNAGINNLTSIGFTDAYILKLDPGGNYIWAKQFGCPGSTSTIVGQLCVDSVNNVYSTGSFVSNTDFDPGPGTFYLNSAGMNDVFISKLDSAGNFGWAKSVGSPKWDGVTSIALDANEDVIVVGAFSDTADFDPSASVFNLYCNANNTNTFVLRLDNAGGFINAFQLKSNSATSATSLAITTSNELLLAGSFRDTADFDPGTGIYQMISTGNRDGFILKLGIPTGIQNDFENDFMIYPNPFNNEITIEFLPAIKSSDANLILTDLAGRRIFESAIFLSDNQRKLTLKTTTLHKGIYFLELKNAQSYFVQKIIKH